MNHLATLIQRYPVLASCKDEIIAAFECIKNSYEAGGKLLLAGNGGSAADAEHIMGELMKSFLRKRRIRPEIYDNLKSVYGSDGERLSGLLEGALPAISLTSMPALSTAFANDVDPLLFFAQAVYGLGRQGDVFLGISTSGNAQNIINAAMTAKACSVKTIALTGKGGGKLGGLCDIIIHAPEDSTPNIQELHLPIYHTLCAMLEDSFFGGDDSRDE